MGNEQHPAESFDNELPERAVIFKALLEGLRETPEFVHEAIRRGEFSEEDLPFGQLINGLMSAIIEADVMIMRLEDRVQELEAKHSSSASEPSVKEALEQRINGMRHELFLKTIRDIRL